MNLSYSSLSKIVKRKSRVLIPRWEGREGWIRRNVPKGARASPFNRLIFQAELWLSQAVPKDVRLLKNCAKSRYRSLRAHLSD